MKKKINRLANWIKKSTVEFEEVNFPGNNLISQVLVMFLMLLGATIIGSIVIIPILIICILDLMLNPKKSSKQIKKILHTYEVDLSMKYDHFCIKDNNNINKVDIPNYSIFIYNYITTYRILYDTTYANGTPQCSANKRRSLGDIFLITRYYYPHITIPDIIEVLVSLLRTQQIGASYCNTIHKYVFHNDNFGYKKDDLVEYSKGLTWSEVVKAYKFKI